MPVHLAGEEIAWSGVMSYDDRYPGKLYVTNRRLFFEQERGKFRKKAYITVETPLNDVTDVSVEKGPWNWNVLVIATKDKNHRFMFREEHPEVLMGRISEILTKRDSYD